MTSTYKKTQSNVPEFFNEYFGVGKSSKPCMGNQSPAPIVPINYGYDQQNVLYLEISAPGFSKDEIKIEIIENSLIVSGNQIGKQTEQEDAEYQVDFIKRSFFKEDFKQSFILEKQYLIGNVAATCLDGIIYISIIPKIPKENSRLINID